MNRVPVRLASGPLRELSHGVLIELSHTTHQSALRRALAEWPLAQYLQLEPPA